MRGDCLSVLFAVDSLNFFSDFHQILNKSKYLFLQGTIRYDTIVEFNVDWKAEYSALSSTRSQKKKLKQPTPVPL